MTQELTAESVSRRARDRQNGYSLLEALIVVSIGLILTAFAVPMVQSALRSYTFNSATSNLSRIVQQARYVALSQGTDACTVFFVGNQFGIDADCDGALASTDARMQLPIGVKLEQISAISTASMPFPTGTTDFTCATFVVTFNSRGAKSSVCGTAALPAATHILYMTMTGWGGTNAVTITGTGRAKSWRWDGSAWR